MRSTDFPAEDWLLKETAAAVEENIVQYARSPGRKYIRIFNMDSFGFIQKFIQFRNPVAKIPQYLIQIYLTCP